MHLKQPTEDHGSYHHCGDIDSLLINVWNVWDPESRISLPLIAALIHVQGPADSLVEVPGLRIREVEEEGKRAVVQVVGQGHSVERGPKENGDAPRHDCLWQSPACLQQAKLNQYLCTLYDSTLQPFNLFNSAVWGRCNVLHPIFLRQTPDNTPDNMGAPKAAPKVATRSSPQLPQEEGELQAVIAAYCAPLFAARDAEIASLKAQVAEIAPLKAQVTGLEDSLRFSQREFDTLKTC